MEKHIFFVTTNEGKFEEVQRWIGELDPSIKLEQAEIELTEIQSLDLEEVLLDKALRAWSILKKPLIVDDSGFYIEKYNRFPGTLTKHVYEGIGLDGIWKLAHDNPRGYFLISLMYIYGDDKYHSESGISWGAVVEPPQDISHKKLPVASMFVPDGQTQTYGKLRGGDIEKLYHPRYFAIKKFVDWLSLQSF